MKLYCLRLRNNISLTYPLPFNRDSKNLPLQKEKNNYANILRTSIISLYQTLESIQFNYQ